MLLVWSTAGREDYLWWQKQDRKVLKHDFSGFRSRRVTDEHRLVYKVTETQVQIVSRRYRYGR